MIGHLQGKTIFSDGSEAILQTSSGVGYQVFFQGILVEGEEASVYISHIVREASEQLFAFKTLKEKKFFELLLTVKGVGPKSAFALISFLGYEQIIDSIIFEKKSLLQKTPGIGAKAASQIILDLSDKVKKLKIYGDIYGQQNSESRDDKIQNENSFLNNEVFEEALLACKELGFKEDKVASIAREIMESTDVSRPEQLVHLVLKSI